MNGKDIFIGLGYIDQKFVEEAEYGQFPKPKIRSLRRPVMIAALIAMLLMLTGCAVAIAGGWFGQYFEQNSGQTLSEKQVEYLAENEQILAESQTKDQWTVELRSALTDGTTGYIIIGITAPEGVDLEPEIVDGSMIESFGAGNGGMSWLDMPEGTPPVLTDSQGITSGGGGSWREDGDGKDNTKNMIIKLMNNQFSPNPDADLFDPDVEYYIHIENIVREYDDEEYKQELLNTKYAGQTDIMFEHEEVQRMHKTDILAEGVWDFTVRFDGTSGQRSEPVELLTEPIEAMAYATRRGEQIIANIYETYQSYEEVEVSSVLLSPLSVMISYECDANCRFSSKDAEITYVVMKDGSQVETFESGIGKEPHNLILEARAPIVLDEVDHILLPDGTRILMP